MKNICHVHLVKDTDSCDHSSLFHLYSRYKHGSSREVGIVAEAIGQLIKKDLTYFQKKNVVLTTVPFSVIAPVSALSAQKIAKKLGIPFLKINTPAGVSRPIVYERVDSKEERKKLNQSLILEKDRKTNFKNKVVFVVDDSCITGHTAKRIKHTLLEWGAREVYVYVFMKINTSTPSWEADINSWIHQKQHHEEFIALLNQPNLQINRFLLKNLFLLSPQKLKKIASVVSKKRKASLAKKARLYFPKSVKEKEIALLENN